MSTLRLGEMQEIKALCSMLGLPAWRWRNSYMSAFGSRKEPRRRNTVPDTLVQYHIPGRNQFHPIGRAYLLYEGPIHELEEFRIAIAWLQKQGRTDIQVLT